MYIGNCHIQKFKEQNDLITTDKSKIQQLVQDFYSKFYEKKIPRHQVHSLFTVCNEGSEDIPEIIIFEIEAALREIENKNNTFRIK